MRFERPVACVPRGPAPRAQERAPAHTPQAQITRSISNGSPIPCNHRAATTLKFNPGVAPREAVNTACSCDVVTHYLKFTFPFTSSTVHDSCPTCMGNGQPISKHYPSVSGPVRACVLSAVEI